MARRSTGLQFAIHFRARHTDRTHRLAKALEKELVDRQARESHDLALKQTAELNRFGPSQELTDRHREEWEEQTKDFAKERERYIVEFYDAQRMVEEMREREKQESLERGDERDKDLGFSR